jgi:hypothetical protein
MIIAKMTLKQVVWSGTTEECGAVVSVPPNTLKKSLRAVRETLCGAASDGEKRGAWDHGLAERTVALRCSGALIPLRLSAKKLIHSPRLPVQQLLREAAVMGGLKTAARILSLTAVRPAKGSSRTVRQSVLVSPKRAFCRVLSAPDWMRNLHSNHISAAPVERSDRNDRAFFRPSTYRPECAHPLFAVQSDRRSTTKTGRS